MISRLFRRRSSAGPPEAEFDLFTLRTGRQTWLAVQGDETEISMAETVSPRTALVACLPRGAPQTSFLLAPDGRTSSV